MPADEPVSAHAGSPRLPPLTLILGGTRSGKSAFAEELCLRSGLEPVYLATARPLDAEMAARIARHRARRGGRWRTVEAPVDLPGALRAERAPGRVVLADGLGVWLTNLLVEGADAEAALAALLAAVDAGGGPLVVVSEEVSLAPVPADPLTRRFVDLLGDLNRALAARAGRVVLVVAGLPLVLGDTFE